MLPSDFTKGRPMTLSEILTLIELSFIRFFVKQNRRIFRTYITAPFPRISFL